MLQMLFRLYPIICLARNSGGADCPCPVLLCFFINHEHLRPDYHSVALQQVDHAPNAKTSSEGNDEGLQHIDCAIEEIHILCAGIVSLWFLRWKPQSRNELAAVCGCRFRLLLSNFRLCFPPTLRFACVCCIVGVLLYGMGV